MKTFGRMVLVAAFTGLTAYTFGQSSSGETPPYAMQSLASPNTVVVSGGLPDTAALVQMGLNDNQAREVARLWGEAKSAVAPLKAQLRTLSSSGDQATTDNLVAKRAQFTDKIDTELLSYEDQIHQAVGDTAFSLVKPFLGARQKVAAGQWLGEERAAAESHPQPANS